jgi:hypothetical protein
MGANEPVLCFVSGDSAYFTPRPLSEQWGDDWDDAPYEHNAGMPSTDGVEIVCVKWESELLVEPKDGFTNSPYTVEQINRGDVPWLQPTQWSNDHGGPRIEIFAGATVSEFVALIRKADGRIWEESKLVKGEQA